MNKAKQQGFTLIEQLIVLALGALLMAGIASSVSAITRAQNLTQDYGDLQETLSFITATLTRSARAADDVNIATKNHQFSISTKANNEEKRKSCLAEEMTETYTETYSLVGNNLVCEVALGADSTTTKKSEVLVFGVSHLNFECAEYQPSEEVEFKKCEEVPLDKVIAVRTNLTLEKNNFLETKQDFEYSATTYLRAAHHKKIQNKL